MADGTEDLTDSFVLKFEKKETFSQFCEFLKHLKEYVYNINIPHSSCICETCEKTLLFGKGLCYGCLRYCPIAVPNPSHQV